MDPLSIIIYIFWVISFFCTVYLSTAFYISGRNSLLNIFSMCTVFMSLNVLLSIIYDGHNLPRGFCYFQGLFLQFTAFGQEASAVCFSIHTYRLIVLNINDTSMKIKKFYYYGCAIYMIFFTTLLGIVSYFNDSIQPRQINCDVVEPAYVRLLGYAGVNVVVGIPAMYLSGHSAYMVFRHLERFKTTMSSSKKSSNLISSSKDSQQDQDQNQDNEVEDNNNDIYLSDSENVNNGSFGNINDINDEENNIELLTLQSSSSPPPPPQSSPSPPPVVINHKKSNKYNIDFSRKNTLFKNKIKNFTRINSKNGDDDSNAIVNNKSNVVVGSGIGKVSNKNNATTSKLTRNQQRTTMQGRLQRKSYNTTRAAAIRMALFCISFIIINFSASLTTIKVVLTKETYKPSIQPNDIIGCVIGIMLTLLFATSSEIRRLWRRDWFKSSSNNNNEKA